MGNRSLGENWRIVGADETTVHLGDIWEIGAAGLEVSKIRTPCQTLATYFGGQPMVRHMTANGLCGWYLRVRRPGLVPTSGIIRVVQSDPSQPTIAEAFAARMRVRAST